MCGIAGVFSQQPQPAEMLVRTVSSMSNALRHRGPESNGHYASPRGHAAIGFRRLAFLDLSSAGNQPMYDVTGQYAIIFNGEAYNFRKLRESLDRHNVRFRSTGDCEVVLNLLIHEGVEALSRLRGMFALAFWDEQAQSLLLARDRFGMKPLVIRNEGDTTHFASEIRGLNAGGAASQKIDARGFYYYLLWGAIASPFTWLDGVESLQPGCWRRYQVGQDVASGRFADVRQIYVDKDSSNGQSALPEIVGSAVEDSVRHHLESDVPVGVFLSGGIDSSALVSAVREVSTSQVATYTIAFEEEKFSEAPIAREVAERFETDHHVCRVTAQDFLKDWPAIFEHYDQPTLDAFNSYYVSKVVKEAGQKVVLSGTGGDEFFGGYPSFRWLPKMQSRRHLLRWLGPLFTKFQKPHRRAKWKHLCRHASVPSECYRSVRGLFMPHELDVLLGPAVLDRLKDVQAAVQQREEEHLGEVGLERPLGTVSRLEVMQYLGSQLLRDIDVMSMAHSLEVRVPLVDHVLAEILWPSLGRHPELMTNKRVLYETLKRPIPEAVYNRPKQGFTFPMERWVQHELQPMIREGIAYLAEKGWIARHVPGQLMQSIKDGTIHWSRPWALAVFGHLARMRSAS